MYIYIYYVYNATHKGNNLDIESDVLLWVACIILLERQYNAIGHAQGDAAEKKMCIQQANSVCHQFPTSDGVSTKWVDPWRSHAQTSSLSFKFGSVPKETIACLADIDTLTAKQGLLLTLPIEAQGLIH